jgi:hypothetical protein
MMKSICARRVLLWGLGLLLAATWAGAQQGRPDKYRSAVAAPRAATYPLPTDVSKLTNAAALHQLTDQQKQQLGQLGFVIVPDQAEQMFLLYEDYPREDDIPVPNFITVDSLLHAYHLFFSYSLRAIERDHLVAATQRMTDIALFHSAKFYNQLSPGPLQEAAAATAIYFAVGKSLLEGQTVSAGVGPAADQIVAAELELIAAHAGRLKSPLLGDQLHYTQFVPRGHYTRSPELSRYFQAMIWYGTTGFALGEEGNFNEQLVKQNRMALLMTKMLSGDDKLRGYWARVYEPTTFFVGVSDDLGYREYVDLARATFGAGLPLEALAEDSLLEQFLTSARAQLPEPAIAPFYLDVDDKGKLLEGTGKVQPRQFRFMGQRYIPDSYILQQLVSPLVRPVSVEDARDIPMGLDVTAALGSERATRLLMTTYEQGRYPRYAEQLEGLRDEFANLPESKWWQNLYWGWLYSLQGLLGEFGPGYPAFMQSDQWEDKELQTALGSWAQLRHDTILYAKPSGAEFGGGEPDLVEGYVEPVPEVWGRLAYLARLSREGLARRELLSPRLNRAFTEFEEVLMFCKNSAESHLQGRRLSNAAQQRILFFGGELERLQLSVLQAEGTHQVASWWEITKESDRHMATIADVHTAFGQALEVGVGPAFRLYVITPRSDGRLQATKGGVFSYYEFLHPADDRLTDEAWIQMIKANSQPAQPKWTESIVVGPAYPGYED